MTLGTKSVLFGGHCLLLHPFFTAFAWAKLYGVPKELRLWLAFFVHDLGYIHCHDLDGPEGEEHVRLGARIMRWVGGPQWEVFTACHSRYWAKRMKQPFSRLCVADKLAFVLTPQWLYLPMVKATGELREYMARSRESLVGGECFEPWEARCIASSDPVVWHQGLTSYTRRWVEKHRDGGEDCWTVVRVSETANEGV